MINENISIMAIAYLLRADELSLEQQEKVHSLYDRLQKSSLLSEVNDTEEALDSIFDSAFNTIDSYLTKERL